MKSAYTTLATPGTKKICVCARRIGSKDRLAVIAVCTDEVNADRIVTGLNRMQGELDKLEIPTQRELTLVREALAREISRVDTMRADVRDKDHRIKLLQEELRRAQLERDAAQKSARETA